MRMKTDAHRRAVAVMPGAVIFELAVPCEAFAIPRPEFVDRWCEVTLCVSAPGTVIVGGFAATTPFGLDELTAADTAIVPACTNVQENQPTELVAAVAEAHARGTPIVSICSSAFVLAQAGLLDGRRATTHRMRAAELRGRFPKVMVDENVISTHGDRIHTSAGTAARIDLRIELVRQDYGVVIANAVARRMVTPPHREADQAQYIPRRCPLRVPCCWAKSPIG